MDGVMKMNGMEQRPTGGHGGGRAGRRRPRLYHVSPSGLRAALTFTLDVDLVWDAREGRRRDHHRGLHKSQLCTWNTWSVGSDGRFRATCAPVQFRGP